MCKWFSTLKPRFFFAKNMFFRSNLVILGGPRKIFFCKKSIFREKNFEKFGPRHTFEKQKRFDFFEIFSPKSLNLTEKTRLFWRKKKPIRIGFFLIGFFFGEKSKICFLEMTPQTPQFCVQRVYPKKLCTKTCLISQKRLSPTEIKSIFRCDFRKKNLWKACFHRFFFSKIAPENGSNFGRGQTFLRFKTCFRA